MPEVIRSTGVRVIVPDTFRVAQQGPRVRGRRIGALPRGPVPLTAGGPAAPDNDALLRALETQGLEMVDALELQPTVEPTPFTGRRRAGAPAMPQAQAATIEVEVGADEHAVVLLEQDGVYSWSMPDSVASVQAAAVARRGGAATAPTTKRIAFCIDIRANDSPAATTRTGLIGYMLYSRVKAYVLKYAARLIVQEGLEYLERNTHERLLLVDSLDPAAWGALEGPGSVSFSAGRPGKALLLVHGTFSSTIGSFGGLAQTPWGQLFLNAAKSQYDVVLGFDHFTLKRDPTANAAALIKELERISWPDRTEIDIVTFSRGGLVVRSLLDQLSSPLSDCLRFGRAIFVACTNEGTQLADAGNIRAFVDLYTNLATAACRLMGMLPHATAVSTILKELIEGMASLIKYVAATALTEGVVPGLAAMEPDGAFLKRLERSESEQGRLAEILNYIVTSEFAPRLSGADVEPKELPARFLTAIAEGLCRQLMGEANDLVVNTASMTLSELQAAALVHDRYDFGRTAKVYHTIYFLRPEVVNALTRWLELASPPSLEAPRTGVSRRPLRGPTRGPAVPTPIARIAPNPRVQPQDVPARVDTRFVLATADSPISELTDAIRQAPTPYVVVERFNHGRTLYYSFPTESVLDKASTVGPDTTVRDTLALRESDASEVRSLSDVGPLASAVFLAADRVVGVIAPEAGSSTDIVALANAALSVTTPQQAAAVARAMPAFTEPSATPATTTLHLRAEIDDPLMAGKATSIDVTLSRQMISGFIAAGARESSGTAAVGRKIAVQAIARSQFAIIGDDRYEIDVPAPDKPWTGSFDVKPTDPGDGEIWIVMSQDQATLATVILNPRIVTNQERAARMVRRASGGESEAAGPIDQLLIVQQRNGNDTTLFFQFQSPTLGFIDKYESRPFRTEPRLYVKNLYEQIEARWVGSKQDVDDFVVELQSLGAELFTELIPDALQQKLWNLRDQLKKVLVLSTEPFIPWEIVHLKEPGKPLDGQLHFLGQMGVVRWLHQAGWPPSSIRVRKGGVRHVIPRYPDPDYVLQAAELERQFMENVLGSTEIDPHSAAVRSALKDPQGFGILHFACHGQADPDNITDARIMLEGRVEAGNYIPEYLSATTVEYAASLRHSGGDRPLVFLNACQAGRSGYKLTGLGGFAQAFLNAGAGIFAGTLWSVGDEPASTFAQCFYKSLKAGTPLSQAMVEAREEARKAGDASWLCYVVYGHPSAGLVME